ncbi:MAG: hypothetical protein ACRC92_15240 [Peptostreptococcaceae bacterium]
MLYYNNSNGKRVVIISSTICKQCNFENDVAAIYCQKCGSFLEPQKGFKKLVKSLNFGSIAGMGAKGTSIAPLAGMDIDNKSLQREGNTSERVSKSYSLEDGSWYCPYCGKKNTRGQFLCGDCLRQKP